MESFYSETDFPPFSPDDGVSAESCLFCQSLLGDVLLDSGGADVGAEG